VNVNGSGSNSKSNEQTCEVLSDLGSNGKIIELRLKKVKLAINNFLYENTYVVV